MREAYVITYLCALYIQSHRMHAAWGENNTWYMDSYHQLCVLQAAWQGLGLAIYSSKQY